MYKKLDNNGWLEYLEEFNSIKDTISLKDFCIKHNINKSQFYYHRKKTEKVEPKKSEPVLHAISIDTKEDILEGKIANIREIKINIGNANITIPVSETTLITTIIKELVIKC